MTEQARSPGRGGRPLPRPDPEALRRAHRLAGTAEAGAEGVAAGTLLRVLADLGVVVLAFPAEAAADPARALGLRTLPEREG